MAWGRRLRALLFRGRANRDLDDEIAAHLEFETRKYMARGISEPEARRRARVEFGGVEPAKEACRDVDHWPCIDALLRDLRHAGRTLAKTPMFTAVAITILTLANGSNLAVFALIDSLFLRPLPVDRPGELLRIASVDKHGRPAQLPSTILEPLRQYDGATGVCGFDSSYEAAEMNGAISQTGTLGFTGDCFQTLGIKVQFGRAITPVDDRFGAPPVAVITASAWRRAFGGRPDVLGKSIRLPGATFTVVGVTEDRFDGLLLAFPAGIIIPLQQESSTAPPGPHYAWVNVLVRRADRVSTKQVAAWVKAQRHNLLEQSIPLHAKPDAWRRYLNARLMVTSAANGVDYFMRDRFAQPLYAVFGICGAILAIACVNLANLMLARALRRRREIAVRLSLGAGTGQVVRLLTTESFLLVFTASAAGVLLARWLLQIVGIEGAMIFGNFHLSSSPDWRVLVFLTAALVFITAAFAAASMWHCRRLSVATALRDAGRGIAPAGSAQRLLASLQMGLTLALVVAASLLGASLRSIYRIDLGVNTENVWDVMLASRPDSDANRYATAAYYQELLRGVESIPGVSSATLCDFVPFFNGFYGEQPVRLLDGAAGESEPRAGAVMVSDSYFRTLGLRIIAGEDFRRDRVDRRDPEVILSESLARQFGDPQRLIGHHLSLGNDAVYGRLQIVGIASNAALDLVNPGQTAPLVVYTNVWDHPERLAWYPVVLIRMAGGALATAAIRHVIHQSGREYVERINTLDAEKDGALVENRVAAWLSGAFGLLALAMAGCGLFGLLSYQVSSRAGEIGIRVALGARRAQIQWLVIRQILVVVAVGSLLGLPLSLVAGKATASLLFGVSGASVAAIGGSLAVLIATALIAAWLPARRAAALDPVAALRQE
ncbi:MAG TPA: ABC transporter permease [Bryobacteraceae bacterium]|nr:ABC transporter permease [Bryobacteraceae bacterium]